jgi:hypothetical protein
MSLDKRVTSEIKVNGPNRLYVRGSGQYNLDENNELETRVVRIHLLQHLLNIACEGLIDCNEMNTLFGTRFESLADELYEFYRPFIEAGVNIFDHSEYYMRDQIKKYLTRPLVGGGMNATAEESTPGLPEGWWYDFPGYAHKHFNFGHIVVSYDEHLIVNTYEGDAFEHGQDPTNWIYISEAKDYAELFLAYPDEAPEISMACKFIKENCNPQI